MNLMDIAKTMVKNRVFDINYSIDTNCDGYINGYYIELYVEICDFVKRFSEQYLNQVVRPELYNELLLGIKKIANDYNCNILFEVNGNILNVIILGLLPR